jgi:hypothetical protein
MSKETGHPDEGLVEDPVEEPLDEPSPAPEDVEPEPSDEPKPTSLRDRFKGKTSEELLEILEEKERELGQRSTDIGDLRARITSLETSQQTVGVEDRPSDDPYTFKPQSGPVVGGPTPAGPGPSGVPGLPPGFDLSKVEWDYEKPVESTAKVATALMAAQNFGQSIKEHNVNTARAKSAFDRGFKAAFSKNKKLMSGIEKRVKDDVYGFYNQFLQQGIPVDDVLITDEPWVKAAQNIRLGAGEYDKIVPDKPKPVAPTITEHPSGAYPAPGKGGKRNLKLDYNDDEVRKIMKDYKITRKEAEEIIAETQEAVEKGELKL